ncbi:MAG: ATP-dependent DNA helicase UvrD2 [Actinobacteria bacterium]|nr:ATP-dependent DNA helicase UvrD2 [Actinomycetota bacterium]
MGDLGVEALLDGLNASQRAAVVSETNPLCILAGAGSGKTRVLTRRIAYRATTGRIDPRRVLTLTFTRKAAGELTNRLRILGLRDSVAAGTFHAVAYAQLRTRWDERNVRAPQLLDHKVGFVSGLVPRALTVANRHKTSTLALDITNEIEWAKARTIIPASYARDASAAHRTPPVDLDTVASVYERYEVEKRKRRLVDFDDLLRLHARDIETDAAYAAAVRWRFQHLFVDEFQDVNPQQHALLRRWLGDRDDLCVVGDPNQAIYAWNGADARYINEFGDHFPGCEVIELRDNYRSSPQILAVANAVLAPSPRRGRGPELDGLRATRPDGPIPDIREYADDEAEAAGVARAVRDARAPRTSWSSQAVLARTNAQTVLIERALRSAGIPCRLRGTSGLLDQPEVKAALRSLERADGAFLVALRDLEDDVLGGRDGPTDGAPPTGERQANVEALLRLGHDYLAVDAAPSTAGFVGWLSDTVRSDQPDHGGDAVDLATFHAAKGLEWPVVHLVGLEQGFVPINHAKTRGELAEERRLFYVALTRAEREAHLSWAAARTFGSKPARRSPSPYLDAVRQVCGALAGGADPVDWAASLAEQRAALRAQKPAAQKARGAGTGDPPASRLDEQGRQLYDELLRWRANTARASAVAAFVVLDNKTLATIAATRPSSEAALSLVPGIGPVKLNRYGPAIIELVANAR